MYRNTLQYVLTSSYKRSMIKTYKRTKGLVDMKITEYTIIGSEKNRPIMIYLGEGNYYAGYDSESGVKVNEDKGFATRFANEKFALEEIGLLQNFFDENGDVVKENV